MIKLKLKSGGKEMSLKTKGVLQPQLAVLRNTPNNLYSPTKTKPEETKSRITNNINELEYEVPTLEEIIEVLATISKERLSENLGFRPEPRSKEDISLGKSASVLVEALLFNPTNKNIKLAMKFLELVQLVKELEDISKEKSQMETIGFKGESKTKDEIIIAENALRLANILKKSPTETNIKSAYKFLEIVERFDSIKLRNKIRENLLTYPYEFSVN